MSALSIERKTIAVGPPGGWGSAFAKVVAERGHNVFLLSRHPEEVEEFQETHRTKRLKGVELPDNVKITTNIKKALEDADVLVLAPPSEYFETYYKEMRPYLNGQTDILILTKGLQRKTGRRMSQILLDMDPARMDNLAVLSGPNIALHVAQLADTGTVVASFNPDVAKRMQSYFHTDHFRIYIEEDVEGVEYGGALKNMMGIGAGIADELGVVESSKAFYVTRALEEIIRYGTTLGAEEATFRGLSGLGDLYLSCSSDVTRNHRVGIKIVQGQSVDEILSSGELAEGLYTIQSAVNLAREHDIDAPITFALYRVLFEGLDIREGINQLMGRQPTREHFRIKSLRFQLARLGMRAWHRIGGNFLFNRSS